MAQADDVIRQIKEAFGANPYPGDRFLQGSFEGCEPYDEVGAFVGKTDWSVLDAAMLDGHYCALGFFSEAGFRFFLPAFLIADLRGQLQTADPLFHLSHGFFSFSTDVPVGTETFARASGGTQFLNPRRYGAMTWADYSRYRLSIFTREEVQAIVAYLNCKRENDAQGLDRDRIDATLQGYWLDRAKSAPTREALQAHLAEEDRFAATLQKKYQQNP
jgi:hypothetical protein